MAQQTRRYDRVAEQYHHCQPHYPDDLISHLATIIRGVRGPDLVVDVGAGTGIFTRQQRTALPDMIQIVGIEPSPAMRAQAFAETTSQNRLILKDGMAEQLPLIAHPRGQLSRRLRRIGSAAPPFCAGANRVLVPEGILAIVECVRDREGSPIAAALIEFMAGYGSDRADTPPEYRDELAEAAGFGASEAFVLPCQLRLKLDAFIGLALSSSHAAGVIERLGADGARSALRDRYRNRGARSGSGGANWGALGTRDRA
jgi:SAM-dependent methyltransferase